MSSYPIQSYGMNFSKGSDFHEWIDGLYERCKLTVKEKNVITYTYDNGYLAHPDYKVLMRKPTTTGEGGE